MSFDVALGGWEGGSIVTAVTVGTRWGCWGVALVEWDVGGARWWSACGRIGVAPLGRENRGGALGHRTRPGVAVRNHLRGMAGGEWAVMVGIGRRARGVARMGGSVRWVALGMVNTVTRSVVDWSAILDGHQYEKQAARSIMSSAEKGPQAHMETFSIASLCRVGRESTGFVRAKNGGTGQFIDGGDMHDNSLVLGELLGTNDESDGL